MNLQTIEERLVVEHDLQDDFAFFSWKCFPLQSEPTIYVEFKGGRCPLLTRGPRKGRPNYRKATAQQTFIVTMDQSERWEAEYEETTGNCRECRGECEVVAKIDFVHGMTTYRDCSRCKGSGRCTTLEATEASTK